MRLYVLRYGSERGKGAYVAATDLGGLFQRSATRWPSRRMARVAADLRTTHEPVRVVRLRPKRMLIGYVVRLDGPGEAPKWCACGEHTEGVLKRIVYTSRYLADFSAEGHADNPHARVVPVHLRVRP